MAVKLTTYGFSLVVVSQASHSLSLFEEFEIFGGG